jgi:hypothetical protein
MTVRFAGGPRHLEALPDDYLDSIREHGGVSIGGVWHRVIGSWLVSVDRTLRQVNSSYTVPTRDPRIDRDGIALTRARHDLARTAGKARLILLPGVTCQAVPEPDAMTVDNPYRTVFLTMYGLVPDQDPGIIIGTEEQWTRFLYGLHDTDARAERSGKGAVVQEIVMHPAVKMLLLRTLTTRFAPVGPNAELPLTHDYPVWLSPDLPEDTLFVTYTSGEPRFHRVTEPKT